MTMAQNTLKELYIDELRDLYDSENQLIKALPKMAKKADSDELRSGIESHWSKPRNTPAGSNRYSKPSTKAQRARSAKECKESLERVMRCSAGAMKMRARLRHHPVGSASRALRDYGLWHGSGVR